MQPKLTFIHISDTHLGATRDTLFDGYPAARCLERLVERINSFPQPPDFVIHTGDLINDRRRASALVARDVLAALKVPIYFVSGNHDDPALLREVLGAPPHPSGDPHAPLDYAFEVKGERFLVVDGANSEVPDPLGKLRDEQIAWIGAEAARDGGPFTLILHYPPFVMGSPWLDTHMPLVNGDALHRALLPGRDRLRGVFFGHLHRTCQIVRDGITYACAGSGIMGYYWRAWDQSPAADHEIPPVYHVVTYFDDYAITQQYALARE